MLRIEDLTKCYGRRKAVDGLSLHVGPGEICGFIGQNGAGKTTTLKSVAGVQPFDSGEIFIASCSLRQDPLSCKRMTAYIPDGPALYDHMTGIQYLGFLSDIFQVQAAKRKATVSLYAELFGMTDHLSSLIGSYSHGMKQKLALIAGFFHDPKLIIMDEPFTGLDPSAAHILKGLMRRFCDDGGGILFSTHVLDAAEKLCDKAAIIQGGKLIRSGRMEEIVKDASLEDVFLGLQEG